jgi:hypothetical protein
VVAGNVGPPRGLRPFLGYQERLIDYINRFIADLANSGAQIAVPLGALEDQGHERLLELAARREAADAVSEGPDAAESLAGAQKQALDARRNRWRGLHDWFTSRDAGLPGRVRRLGPSRSRGCRGRTAPGRARDGQPSLMTRN